MASIGSRVRSLNLCKFTPDINCCLSNLGCCASLLTSLDQAKYPFDFTRINRLYPAFIDVLDS